MGEWKKKRGAKKSHMEFKGESGKAKGGTGGEGIGVGFNQNALYMCTKFTNNENNFYSKANSMSVLGMMKLICNSSQSSLYISITEPGSDVITNPSSL